MTIEPQGASCSRSASGALGSAGGYDDAIEEPVVGPAHRAVPVHRHDIIKSEPLKSLHGQIVKFEMAFDGEDMARKLRKDRRLVARACSDFENILIGRHVEPLAHIGDDVGL